MTDDDRTVFQPRPDPAPAPPTPAAWPTDTSQALPNGFRLDEFEIQAKLGEGGFGIVYRAWDHSLGQVRAIKEYMPGAVAHREGTEVVPRSERVKEAFDSGLQRFIEEAQTLARFDHPALVRVLRRWEAHGTAYMAMPLYEGRTLREHIKQSAEKPSESWLLGLLAPLTEAMQGVHQNHWLHRDIAPDNIMLLKDSGRPLLLDFGAARQVIGDVTQDLTAILKPGFAPVEQYGDAPGLGQGPWTDVYALAATIHWALIGKTPPPSVSRVLVDSYQPLVQALQGQYSARFLGALDKALRVDARQRTQSMAEFRADLGLEAPSYAPTMELPVANPLRAETAVGSAWEPTALLKPVGTAAPSLADAPTQVLSQPVGDRIMQTLQVPSAGRSPPLEKQDAPASSPSTRRSPVGLALLAGGVVLIAGLVWAVLPRGAAPNPSADPTARVGTQTAPPVASAPAAVTFEWEREVQSLLSLQDATLTPVFVDPPTALSIRKHDRFRFKVRAPQAGYLTLFLRDSSGQALQLFADQSPLAVKAGQVVTLPPPGATDIEAADPPGPHEVLAILTRAPHAWDALVEPPQNGVALLRNGAEATTARRAWTFAQPILAGRPSQTCPASDSACGQFGAVRLPLAVTP
ncbi:serine/threonine-protein kinase [Inhella gelatinilytica]|uniref:Protein kinase n=1 Tax=Inhella gelatinilytica TaxID=2795030 RepID=A0A931J2C8_9BURK|nr:serine/threonine-protein kinase [Inhella gelatinilytica]MBH9554071.1 protein kinase [Inhella gelatinilytica]